MPRVKVRYFGRLRELLNVKEEEHTVKAGASIADLLLKYIPEKHKEVSEAWRETIFRTVKGEMLLRKDGTPLIRNYLVLMNGKSPNLGCILKEGDEVAVLPPFGGG